MGRALLDLGELGRAVARLEADGVRVYAPDGSPASAALELAALAVLARRGLTGGADTAEEIRTWTRVH